MNEPSADRSDVRNHWEAVWRQREPDQVSWYQPTARRSLELISIHAEATEPVIDVGAGSSSLVDELLDAGFADLTVLDVSESALAVTRRRLGPRAEHVEWIVDDVLTHKFERQYELWHDRAVFHFLVDPRDQVRYVEQVERAIKPGGHLVLGTFGPDGPTMCSGLPVERYGESDMVSVLGDRFSCMDYTEVVHTTPGGGEQQFAFAVFRYVKPPRE